MQRFFKKYWPLFVAMAVAPLTAGIGYALAFYYGGPNDFWKLIDDRGWWHMLGPNIFVTPVSYVLAIALWFPIYLALLLHDLAKWYIAVPFAAAIGLCFTWFVRFQTTRWEWEFGLFPAVVVSSTVIIILRLLKFKMK